MTLAIGLDVARSGLAVASDQIATISRNVARAGEADATRKIVQVVTGPGGGVRTAGWVRSADAALLDRVLAAASATGAHEEIVRALGELSSATVGDPEFGRSPAALIARLEGALHQAATAPQDEARARLAIAAANDLAQSLNDATRAVTAIRQRADEAIAASVATLNGLLGKFEVLNREVVGGTRRGAERHRPARRARRAVEADRRRDRHPRGRASRRRSRHLHRQRRHAVRDAGTAGDVCAHAEPHAGRGEVGLELLNDVTFLLEQHVMTPEQTTTPMRQLYFMVQTLLIEPAAAHEARALAEASLTMMLRTYANRDILDALLTVRELMAAGRAYEALRAIRALFPIEDALLGRSAARLVEAKEAKATR